MLKCKKIICRSIVYILRSLHVTRVEYYQYFEKYEYILTYLTSPLCETFTMSWIFQIKSWIQKLIPFCNFIIQFQYIWG